MPINSNDQMSGKSTMSSFAANKSLVDLLVGSSLYDPSAFSSLASKMEIAFSCVNNGVVFRNPSPSNVGAQHFLGSNGRIVPDRSVFETFSSILTNPKVLGKKDDEFESDDEKEVISLFNKRVKSITVSPYSIENEQLFKETWFVDGTASAMGTKVVSNALRQYPEVDTPFERRFYLEIEVFQSKKHTERGKTFLLALDLIQEPERIMIVFSSFKSSVVLHKDFYYETDGIHYILTESLNNAILSYVYPKYVFFGDKAYRPSVDENYQTHLRSEINNLATSVMMPYISKYSIKDPFDSATTVLKAVCDEQGAKGSVERFFSQFDIENPRKDKAELKSLAKSFRKQPYFELLVKSIELFQKLERNNKNWFTISEHDKPIESETEFFFPVISKSGEKVLERGFDISPATDWKYKIKGFGYYDSLTAELFHESEENKGKDAINMSPLFSLFKHGYDDKVYNYAYLMKNPNVDPLMRFNISAFSSGKMIVKYATTFNISDLSNAEVDNPMLLPPRSTGIIRRVFYNNLGAFREFLGTLIEALENDEDTSFHFMAPEFALARVSVVDPNNGSSSERIYLDEFFGEALRILFISTNFMSKILSDDDGVEFSLENLEPEKKRLGLMFLKVLQSMEVPELEDLVYCYQMTPSWTAISSRSTKRKGRSIFHLISFLGWDYDDETISFGMFSTQPDLDTDDALIFPVEDEILCAVPPVHSNADVVDVVYLPDRGIFLNSQHDESGGKLSNCQILRLNRKDLVFNPILKFEKRS